MHHSTRARPLASAALVLAACARGSVPSPGAPDPSVARTREPAPEARTPPSPSPSWSEHYRRRCIGSITPPVVSLDHAEVVICDARFSLARGRYEGPAPLGVLALLGEHVVTDDYGEGGPSLRDLDGQLVRHVAGGRPEHAVASLDGSWLALVETTEEGRSLGVWSLPGLERVRSVAMEDAGPAHALAIDDGGRVRWYGERGCRMREVECPASVGPCQQLRCDAPEGLVLGADGATRPWTEIPIGLSGLAVSAEGSWLVAIEGDGRRWLGPVDEPDSRIEIPGRSEEPEWPGYALALTSDASTLALADAEGIELWRREDGAVTRLDSLPITEVGGLAITPDGAELLVARHDDVTVHRPGPPPVTTDRPLYDPPMPPAWERAPVVDGQARWADGRGTMWPGEPGIVAWARDAEDGAELRVVVGDRAEIDRPELDVDAWARVVLERLDELPWEDGRIAMPHTLHTWVEDGERRLELHYTTQDGCEHFEVVRRVAEHGEWLVRHELHTYEGMPWRDAWAVMVHGPEGPPPSEPIPSL